MTGDFKFCPTCAYRLKPGTPIVEVAGAPRSRSVASMLFMVGAALFVGLIAGVGFWLFRDERKTPMAPPTARVAMPPPAEKLRAATVGEYLQHIPAGVAYWGEADPGDRPRMVLVELDVLAYEVTCGFYAEFTEDLHARLQEGEAPPPTLQRIWQAKSEYEIDYAHRYLTAWIEAYLERSGVTPTDPETTPPPESLLLLVPEEGRKEAAASIAAFVQAVPFPWDPKLGLLLLAPPSWAYLNPWDELRWEMPRGTDTLPVTGVAWTDAVAFCEWLTAQQGNGDRMFRLPLSGEWMRVAHGNHPPRDDRAWLFPWGASELTHACNNSEFYAPGVAGALHPVSQRYIDSDAQGSYDGRTVDGVFSMAGNAGEWVLKQAEKFRRVGDTLRVYYDAEDDRERLSAWYKGGTFRVPLMRCTVETETWALKSERDDAVGFRFVAVPRGE